MKTVLNRENFLEIFIRLTYIMGFISLSVAVIMFVAFNWNTLSIFEKFGLAQGAFVLPIFILMFVKSSIIKEVLLFSASILVGANLALIGQVYQSGADTWQLFAFWAALLLPFLYAQRSVSIYLLFIVIVNIALYLFYDIYRWFDYLFGGSYILIGVAVNLIFWLISMAIKNIFLESILAIVVFAQATLFAIINILESHYQLATIYLFFLGSIYLIYGFKKTNIFYMQLFIVSLTISFLTLVAQFLLDELHPHNDFAIVFISFIILIMIISTTFASYKWINSLKEKADE